MSSIGGMPHDQQPEERKTLARSLGEFFGHVWKGVKTDPAAGVRRERTEEFERQTRTGKVRVRRTVIEEVELDPGAPREG